MKKMIAEMVNGIKRTKRQKVEKETQKFVGVKKIGDKSRERRNNLS